MNKKIKYITEDGRVYKGKRNFTNGRWYTGVTQTATSKPLITQTTIIEVPERQVLSQKVKWPTSESVKKHYPK